jgi:hypothetical protein
MSEISETEIKSMTKEQNYIRGYRDGKSDVLDKIRDEINEHIEYNKKMNYMGIVSGLLLAKNVLDKYKAESEG